MKSKSEYKRIGVQQGLSFDDIIKVVQEPENSKNKLLELKDKYNISDKDFENFLFYASMYNMTKY